jgi:CheY-like chemotaxis protein
MADQEHPATVMIVDGDVITRTVLADYLRHCGYRVIECRDAKEAIMALEYRAFRTDVVLSDAELPGATSGFELAAWVRNNMPDVKVVLAAAVLRAAQVAGELCEEGPELAKPYDPQIVMDHIKRLRGQ